MSTIHDLTARLPDDDEEDSDFIPLPDEGQLSHYHSPETEPEPPDIEHDVLSALGAPTEHDVLEGKRKQRAEVWSKFLAMDPPRPSEEPFRKLVKVVKTYKFAGKEMEEILEVPEDSPDAAKWPRYEEETSSTDASEARDVPMTDLTAQPCDDISLKPALPYKRPGPRRGKVTLPGFTMGHKIIRTPTSPHVTDPTAHATNLPTRDKPFGPVSRTDPSNPAHLSSNTTLTTLTTLDKSALDWRSHVGAQETPLRDELDANRRGGGYLEKVAFMQRVEQRKEGLLEAGRGGRRRRGG
ncbi:uncharacterized protein SCHCODRAFT_02671166 [Schizophyllum commune H4-8]|nr:uncharacterized protein SCHCODRAFT_02671166 [Schizophyllum commune H4-8]KAI5888589.1 hypothetical protein SCHCODRAFT_02671166 [Schizophyllum commune H4-8]